MRIHRILLYGATLFILASCFKDEKQSTSPQAAITSFTLGYYNVKFHDLNLHRRDTIVMVREGGVMYPMTIDQSANKIYNVDSLAYGSIINGVTCSVGGNGTIIYRYTDEPDVNYLWQSGDTIDFTRKLQFCAVSSDGTYTRTYDLQVNVHTLFPDSLIWTGRDSIQFPQLLNPSSVILNDSIYCFGEDANGVISITSRHLMEGAWSKALPLAGLPSTGWSYRVALFGDRFFTVFGNTLYVSDNGNEWSLLREGIKTIFTSHESSLLWAVGTNDSIMSSANAEQWDAVQAVPVNFPDSVALLIAQPLATNTNITRHTLIGPGSDPSYNSVWTMLSIDSIWTEVLPTANMGMRLPLMDCLSVISYDGFIFALGKGADSFWQSQDHGLTWSFCDSYSMDYSSWNRYMQLPKALKGYAGSYTTVVDNKGSIWIMTDNSQVWRGAINRLNRR